MEIQTSVLVLLLLSTVFSLFGYKKSVWGLYLLTPLVILMHKQYFSLFGVWDLLPIRIAASFLFFGYLIRIYRDKSFKLIINDYKKNPYLTTLIVLIGVITLSFANTISFQESVKLFAFLCLQVFLIFITVNLINTETKLFNWIKIYIYTIGISILFAVFQYWYFLRYNKTIGALWYIPGVYTRVGSLFWDVNHFGAFLVAGLFITFSYFLIIKQKYFKVISLFVSLFTVPILILTNSRSAWGGAFVGAILYAGLLYKNGYKKFVLLSVIALVALSISVFSYVEIKTDFSFVAWYANYTHTRLDSSESHMILLNKAWQVFKVHQLVGGGYGNFNEQLRTLNAKDNEYYFARDPGAAKVRVPSHSVWGQMLSETGLLGFGVFSFFNLIVLIGLIRLSIKNRDVFASGLIASLVSTLSSGIFYSYNLEFFWWIYMFSIIYILIKTKTKLTFNTLFDWVKSNNWIVLLLIALFAGFYIFLGLGTNALIDYDEAIYAKVAKNIVDGKGIATLYWNLNTAWFEKPPLYMWLTAPLLKITGYMLSSWAVRFWSAMFGFGTVIITFLLAKKKFGLFTGFVSAIVLTTTIHYLYYSKIGMLDISVTFFITSALYIYIMKKRNFISALAIGILIGMAVLTKAIVGLLPLAVIGLFELLLIYDKKTKIKQSINRLVFIILGLLLIALPWHVYESIQFGRDFWNSYFFQQIVERGVTGTQGKSAPFFWYLVVLKVSMRFWFIALIPSLFIVLYKAYLKKNLYKLLLIWALTFFLFFSISNTKLIWYIIPIYPVLAIIVGIGATNVFTFLKTRLKNYQLQIEIASVVVILLIGFYNVYLVRDRVWTPDFNKFKKVLVNTANEKFLNRTLYYVEMDEPVIRFYADTNTKIKGVSSSNIWSAYESLSYSQPMLVIGGDDIHKLFNDRGIRVLKVNEEDDYFLFDIQSEYAFEQGKVNKIKAEYNALLKDVKKRDLQGLYVLPGDYEMLNTLLTKYKKMQQDVNIKLEEESDQNAT